MKTKMTKWFTPYKFAVPAQYEEWFENLALEGWHPEKVEHISSFKMNFIKGDAKKYRYVVDLQANPKKEYKQIYGEFGWEFVGQMSSLFVWRKEHSEEKPESFSDRQSIDKRNKRFTTILSIMATIFSCAFIIVAVLFGIYFTRLTSAGQYIQFIAGMLLSGIISIFMFSRLRQFAKYKKLNK